MSAPRPPTRAIDVRAMPTWQRHPRIFDLFDRLAEGEALLLTSDHEPRPLRAEFERTRSGRFVWAQRERGPHHWEATIRRIADLDPNAPIDALRRCVTFASLPDVAMKNLASRARLVAVRRNRAVVEQGIAWPYLGVVAAGVVQAVMVAPDGRELAIHDVLTGEAFGEAALLDGAPSALRCVARAEGTRVLLLPRDALVEAVRAAPRAFDALAALCAQRFRVALARYCAHAVQPIASRIAEALLAYASPAAGLAPALPPLPDTPQVDLAVVAGTAKEMVYRAVTELEAAGALRRENGRISHLDRAKLTRIADTLKR